MTKDCQLFLKFYPKKQPFSRIMAGIYINARSAKSWRVIARILHDIGRISCERGEFHDSFSILFFLLQVLLPGAWHITCDFWVAVFCSTNQYRHLGWRAQVKLAYSTSAWLVQLKADTCNINDQWLKKHTYKQTRRPQLLLYFEQFSALESIHEKSPLFKTCRHNICLPIYQMVVPEQ